MVSFSIQPGLLTRVRLVILLIGVPPSAITIVTSPKDIVIRQGEQLMVPANIYSTFSNNVTDHSFNGDRTGEGSDFNSSGLSATIESIRPSLFKIIASPQTPEGFYTIPFTASLFLETMIESLDIAPNNNENITMSPFSKHLVSILHSAM